MKRLFLIVFVTLVVVSESVKARVFLQISQNLNQKVPLAILLVQKRDTFWEKFSTTLKRDLEYSGYFTIQKVSFLSEESLQTEKNSCVQSLVLTSVTRNKKISFSIEDTNDQERLWNQDYSAPVEPRSFAHQVADDLVLALTGKPGIASSRIFYVSSRTGSYQIYCIDADGENERQITDFPFMVHYPRWIPTSQKLLLVSYEGGWPKLIQFDPVSRNTSLFLAEPGLNACASFCQTTGEVAVVLSKSGNPEIYLFRERDRYLKQLTYDRAIDSSPSFSPDGKLLAFVSDRQGKPQIFLMNRDGFQVRRISFLSGYCTSPAWSPDGNFIAYVFSHSGTFGLAVYEVKTRQTIVVDENLGAEDVSWAADSRHLVYSRATTSSGWLGIIDIITREKRKLTKEQFNCFSPCWAF